MEQENFKELAEGWDAATQHVLSSEAIDRKILSHLFLDTYLLIKKYSTESMIPRGLYQVLWEMNDFHWWVVNSEDTPIHFLYPDIIDLVLAFNDFVVRGWTNELDVKYLIAKIEGEL